MGDDGKPVMPGGQSSPTFTGLHESENYSAQACTANGFGVASAKDSAFVWTSTPAPAGPLSYTVSTTPTYTSASTAEYDVTAPSVPDSGPYKPYYRVYDGKFDQTAFALTPDAAPSSPAVMYCESVGVACSAATDITAATTSESSHAVSQSVAGTSAPR